MRPKLVAVGILGVYTVSNIYLEHIVGPYDPLLRTVFFFAYFFAWISPLIYLWLKGKIQESFVAPILVLCLAILYVSPLVTIPVPVGLNFPDVDFHAAKILYSSTGHFFKDPVSSYPSIYPSVYHILIGSIMRVVGSDNSWLVLSRFHVLMLIALLLSVYLLANSLFNPRVGLLSVLFFGGVFDMPNWSGMFLPTPFLLGLLVIINSVTLVYLTVQGKRWCLYPAGLVTGLAVTIWPAFLPVAMVLVLAIFFAPDKKFRRQVDPLKFILAFLVVPVMVWVPQYLLLSKHHLMGHHTIGRFKGIPEPAWFLDLISRLVLLGGFDRHQHEVTILFGTTYVILVTVAVLGFRSLRKKYLLKKRFLGLFFVSMLTALPIVHYVFSLMYSRRVQVLFSTLVAVVAAYYLVAQLNRKYRLWAAALIVWIVAFTSGWNIYMAHKYVLATKDSHDSWKKYATGVLTFMESNTTFGDYIFATQNTYRFVVIGNLVRFNLVAHREGGYYSLNPELSEKMANHYNAILRSNDIGLTKKILGLYKIRYVLVQKGEQVIYPGLRQLFENCTLAYKDDYYAVLRCDFSPK
jgi:4-amino-4-deoxy-L-arabinose transferase-like glycosyltransferase